MSQLGQEFLAVVDIGKTNIKLIVVGSTGESVEQLSVANEVIRSGLYPHFDVEAIFEWILAGLSEFAKRYTISAIVPVTHGATGVLCAGDCLALPVLDYEFAGPEAVNSEYRAAASEFSKTSSPDLPNGLNFGKQLFWQKREFSEAFASATHVLMYPQYWAYRLTGHRHTEVTSLGCHTGLWEPAGARFSNLAMQEGFDKLFPPLKRAYESAGPLLPELARRTGLNADVKVLTGIHDSNASYFAHAAPRRGQGEFAVASTGTWVVCMANGVDVAELREELDMLANCDAFGAPVASIRFMGGREYEAVAGTDGLQEAPGLEDVALVLATSFALPSFASQGGPFRNRVGRFEGETPTEPKRKAALAALYSALLTDHCLDLLGARGELIVDGAFAKNQLFLGLLSALRGGAVCVSDSAHAGTARGAAQLLAWPESLQSEVVRVEALEVPGLNAYRGRWRQYLTENR